jgi:hypothetical protein
MYQRILNVRNVCSNRCTDRLQYAAADLAYYKRSKKFIPALWTNDMTGRNIDRTHVQNPVLKESKPSEGRVWHNPGRTYSSMTDD